MALKDWKVYGQKFAWRTVWINKNLTNSFKIYKDIFIIKYTGNKYWTFVDRVYDTTHKTFKTKSAALKFAYRFMRTH